MLLIIFSKDQFGLFQLINNTCPGPLRLCSRPGKGSKKYLACEAFLNLGIPKNEIPSQESKNDSFEVNALLEWEVRNSISRMHRSAGARQCRCHLINASVFINISSRSIMFCGSEGKKNQYPIWLVLYFTLANLHASPCRYLNCTPTLKGMLWIQQCIEHVHGHHASISGPWIDRLGCIGCVCWCDRHKLCREILFW